MADVVQIGRKRVWMTSSSLTPRQSLEVIETEGYQDMKDILDSTSRQSNLELLEECRKMYDGLQTFRDKADRAWRYATGDQWGDKIIDPDDPYHRMITEGEYIRRQGKQPLKNNVITPLIKSTLGIYRGNKKEPMCICRDRDEAKLGDMMSAAVQYAYQINKCDELNARQLQKSLTSAMYLASVNYQWDDKRKRYEVFIKNEDQNRVFFNGDIEDIRTDLHTIGFVRDMTLDAILERFCSSEYDVERVRNEYKYVAKNLATYMESIDTHKKVTNFYTPNDINKCRLIEVWKKECQDRLRCHDYMNGEVFICETDERGEIDKINAQRKADYVAQGMSEEDAPLIVAEWFIDRYWYVRYMTPMGAIIAEKRSPYLHGSHPYVLNIYPMINGESHSFVEDIIDQQRYVNRYVSMMDYITGASAKGLLLLPKGSLPDNMTIEDAVREWSRPDGVLEFQWKAGMPAPSQLSTSGVQASHVEMLNIQLKMLEDISGVHAAMQGQAPSSGTPSALYAQQAQNSSNNLTDFISWFDSCVAERDYKMMQVIQQYYNEPRYIAIAGHDYDEESKWYTPEKVRDSQFDITINEATVTPAYRNVMNDFLMQMFQSGAIDVKMFLENVNMPFAEKLLESVKRKEQEMQQQAAMEQQQAMAMQGGNNVQMPGQADPSQGGGIATAEDGNRITRQMNEQQMMSLINESNKPKSQIQ